MRLPPLWLPSLLLCGLGATAPWQASFCPSTPSDSSHTSPPPQGCFHQLDAPRHPKLHLYNEEQILSWDPSPPSNDTRPVVYEVQYTLPSGRWSNFDKVSCTDITAVKCDFTKAAHSTGLSDQHAVFLRVRAKQGGCTSAWVTLPCFQHYLNVTIGPPKNILVTPGNRSLNIRFSPPFDPFDRTKATFEYHVHYWEKSETPQVKGPFNNNLILLNDLKPFRKYCLQINAQLILRKRNIYRSGLLSNISCHETTGGGASPKLVLISLGIFLLLLALTGACFFLFLKYLSHVKFWFQAPPNIPEEIKEYLKDPDQLILEALDKDSSPKEDAWDSVSIISSPSKELMTCSKHYEQQEPVPAGAGGR